MDIKKIKNFFTIHRIVACIILIVIGLVIFKAGVYVGFKKASFSRELGNSYFRTFGGGERMGGMMRDDIPGGHGVVGKVIKVSPGTLVVEGSDNIEKIVSMNGETMVRKLRDMASTTSIQVNDTVVVIGAPGQKGEIAAKLVRIIPTQK